MASLNFKDSFVFPASFILIQKENMEQRIFAENIFLY